MKKLLLTLLLLLSLGFAASAAGTDVLTNASLNNGNNTNSGGYKAFTSGVFESGAQYAGKVNFVLNTGTYYFALNNGNANASDIVTTKSGGLASRVTITWTTKVSTSNGRVVKIYGQHDAYTSGDKAQGTEIGSATKGTSASETIELTDKSFEYIAISAASAVNLESIEIEWIDASGSEREKIDLVQDNLVVKAGDVVLEDEEEVELDANTIVAFAYTTDVENADIAYSYSINGEDAIDGKSYTFTGEEDVIFTATATSNNEVSKTVYLLKKYPTECPTPSFSVADGAEVYAGQIITVKAEGAESILLEANGDLQDGTSYTVAGEPGDVITLYALASVTGKNGAITAENSINVTVVEATEATFT
ncbi:MAG: hypothetical protein K2F97_03650, partial [Muribaculaceae bacterium]|nr:hypothetical protein [Muribaculaceae bacterium]